MTDLATADSQPRSPSSVTCARSTASARASTSRSSPSTTRNARVQALRFGMAEGACVECVTRIPAGPLVIKSGRQEIAVGRALAKRISVRRLSS